MCESGYSVSLCPFSKKGSKEIIEEETKVFIFLKTRPKVYRFGLRDKQKEKKKQKEKEKRKKEEKKREKRVVLEPAVLEPVVLEPAVLEPVV